MLLLVYVWGVVNSLHPVWLVTACLTYRAFGTLLLSVRCDVSNVLKPWQTHLPDLMSELDVCMTVCVL